MRKSVVILALTLLLVASSSLLASAGSGVKFETSVNLDQMAGGIELELGIPGVPLVVFGDAMGSWDSQTSKIANLQVGAGGRFFLINPGGGPYLEAKLRHLVNMETGFELEKLPIIVGGGFRVRALICKLDLSVHTSLGEHAAVPKVMIGVQVGF